MNDADRHLLTLFSAALGRDTAGDRAAFLDGACAGDPDLREPVEALLWAHDRPGRFLDSGGDGPTRDDDRGPSSPSGAGTATSEPHDAPPGGLGAEIGPYRLLQVIGEGGMGTVYVAEQSRPVRRRVALKVVRAGMDSRPVLARFEAERQALALMDHPNIARVLDAGATPGGRPYFAMELVKGTPITRFCDERRLTPRERIELLVPVCQAVQHAHQKGVIHRDLKPSNVLVSLYDDRPVPKVIDFGIAKAAGTKLAERTVVTEFGAIVGTLEYMSPEQAQLNQLDIDTRSDVYSLGVLLYELLTGTTPMDRGAIGGVALLEVLRLIREAETPRPSLRLSTAEGLPTIAAARGLEPRKLSSLVRGDLDWIVMKALEKDRARRYESASALARDLERHLQGEAVEACPPSAGYRLGKFARRHRVALAAGATIAATLVVATAVSTWQAVRATRAERSANEAAEVAQQTARFCIGDLLGKADVGAQVMAGIAPDPDLKVRTLIDRAAAQIDGQFDDQPLLEAAVRRMVGEAYSAVGHADRGRAHLERSHEIYRRLQGEDHPDTLRAVFELANLEAELSLYGRAEERLRPGIDRAVRRHGEGSRIVVNLLSVLGRCLMGEGRHDEAVATLRRALELARRVPEYHPLQRLAMQNNLALNVMDAGDEAGAEALMADALREGIAELGEDRPLVPLIRNNLALIRRNRRPGPAEADARKALEGCRRLYGDRHRYTLECLRNIGTCQRMQSRSVEAEATFRSALGLAREGPGPESEQALLTIGDLAYVLTALPGRAPEAEAMLREAMGPARRLGARVEAELQANLGIAVGAQGRYPEAEELLARAVDLSDRQPATGLRSPLQLRRKLAEVIAQQGRHREAIGRLRDLLARVEGAFGRDDVLTFYVLFDLASGLRIVGDDAEAAALYPRVIALGEALGGVEARNALGASQNYAALLHVRGKFAEAEALYRRGLEWFSRPGAPEDIGAFKAMSNLGELYRDWGRPDDAVPLLTRAREGIERHWGAGSPFALWSLWKLAELERDRGRLDVAEPMFLRGLEGYAKSQGEGGLELAMIRADLALNYLKKREPDHAEPLLRRALRTYEAQLPDDWRRFEIQSQLGEALTLRGRPAEAEPLLLAGSDGLSGRWDRVTVDAWRRRPEAGQRVVRLYESWGKPDQADAWRKRLQADGPPAPVPKAAAAGATVR